MTEGNVLILEAGPSVGVLMEGRFPDIGGIWAICSCNSDRDLALGTVGGLYLV
jgi:hypothetical protein